ncbi:hypothetical protein BDQ17DRAFT_1362324 [Cyathus striatus]|nr:hypothetical protein BDQ17DRAFT_1362324 [Cyathus striatus]
MMLYYILLFHCSVAGHWYWNEDRIKQFMKAGDIRRWLLIHIAKFTKRNYTRRAGYLRIHTLAVGSQLAAAEDDSSTSFNFPEILPTHPSRTVTHPRSSRGLKGSHVHQHEIPADGRN